MAKIKAISHKDIPVSFKPVNRDRPHRITLAIQGPEMSGKSHFMFTAPQPICVFTTEINKTENAARHFPDVHIDIAEFNPPKGIGLGQIIDDKIIEGRVDHIAAWNEWQRFIAYYEEAVTSGKYKTVGWDKETGVWELCRLAYFGRLLKVKSREYGLPGADMSGLIKLAAQHGVNLIMLRETKEAYLEDKPTGKIIGRGYNGTNFLSDVVLATRWDRSKGVPNGFSMEIEACSGDMTLCGDIFVGKELTFQDVAAWIVKGSKKKDWR